jgi:histidine ammonia-lyase
VKGKSAAFEQRVHALRPHPGQIASARNIRALLQGSNLINRVDDDTMGKVQDSYSVRCAAQVHGASRDALGYVRRVLETEINSATDNPLIFPDDESATSAGNFHGQPVALALDFLALAVAELGNISERRTAKLMDRHHNFGLPAFLATRAGLHSGLMMLQYTAAALVSENKVLIHPASGDSIPTSANQEDHVSMGTIAARHAAMIVENARHILAIELLCAAQALEFRAELPGRGTRRACTLIRRHVKPLDGDRNLAEDIQRIVTLIRQRRLASVLAP